MSNYTKIITLDPFFPTGEPTVQLVSTWGSNGRLLREKTSCHKTAAHSPAQDYINSIEPEPGKSIVLVVGLGDHETYGPNRNGDGFPSKAVKGKISSSETLPNHYKTYEKAHVFEHHVNSDPKKAIGCVKKAFWNPYMRRVEVVEDFDHAKAPHLLEKIASGEYPAKSMGCRIKYDVCSRCGNKARTRGEYCEHLKYAMSQIDPNTGEQNAALNPSPVFFDSSWVIRPADRTGYMLKKVANERIYDVRTASFDIGSLVADLTSKAAALAKAADIEKVIGGEPASSVSNLDDKDTRLVQRYMSECGSKVSTPEKGKKAVRIMITYKPSDAVAASDAAKLPLGMGNLLNYFLGRANSDLFDCGCGLEKAASQHLELIYRTFSEYPRFFDDVVKLGQLTPASAPDPMLLQKLAFTPTTPTQDYVNRALMPSSMQGSRARTDLMTWTDPNTGRRYETNYGTVQKTNDALVEQDFKHRAMSSAPLLGAGALLGGATMAMGLSPKLRGLPRLATGLAAIGSTAAGVNKAFGSHPLPGPKVLTDQGDTISGWTEMVPKTGSDAYNELSYLVKRANDANSSRLSDTYITNFLTNIKKAEVHDELAGYIGPTLDLDYVSNLLGKSLIQQS